MERRKNRRPTAKKLPSAEAGARLAADRAAPFLAGAPPHRNLTRSPIAMSNTQANDQLRAQRARGAGLKSIDRIWARFALGIALTVLVTIGTLTMTVFVSTKMEFQRFYDDLPANARHEMAQLLEQTEDDSQLLKFYNQYWRGDPWDGERMALIMGLMFCIPFGMISGLWISRLITLPVNSIAQAARRIALGDFSVRAYAARQHGEMAGLISDFNHMADSLEALEYERKASAAAISHELRTPLAVLQARLHALCDGVIPAQPEEFNKLLEQVEHLRRLVDDLHTLSVADSGRLSLHPTSVDLAELARDVLGKFASRLASYRMSADLVVEAPQLRVHADQDRLRQVLHNLIENALRYAHSGEWLEIALRAQGDEALIVISDAGPGLPESIKAHLFQRFQRSEASRNRASGGTGLGLAIVHTLTVLQGGRISSDTSPRGGARFTIRLPREKTADAPAVHGATA